MSVRALALALLVSGSPLAASAAGRVVSTTGELTAGGKPLRAGDALPDAEIRLESGTATLAIDGGRFLLKGPARLTPKKTVFRLEFGSLLSVLKHRAGLRFTVRTPTAVAAVRGTDFFVEVRPKSEADVCICRGALEVTAKGMKALPMAAENHLLYRFAQAASRTSVDRKPSGERLGHNDAELDALRALLAEDKP